MHPDKEKQIAAANRSFVRQQQKADAPVAMSEYLAAEQSLRDRTRKLREERLAREASAPLVPAKSPMPRRKARNQ